MTFSKDISTEVNGHTADFHVHNALSPGLIYLRQSTHGANIYALLTRADAMRLIDLLTWAVDQTEEPTDAPQ